MAVVYTRWADPLLDTINADIDNTSTLASSLLTPIVYGADLFGGEAKFLTGNFSFDGYMGVPRLMGADAEQAAAEFNVAWQTVDPALNPSFRALTSAASLVGASGTYATSLRRADLISDNAVKLTNSTIASFSITLNSGTLYAPLVTNQTSGESYFAFAAANPDKLEHFTGFGSNGWGMEDLYGGGDRDYDDLIVRFSLGG